MALYDVTLETKLASEAHVAAIQRACEDITTAHGLGLEMSLLMHVERAAGSKPGIATCEVEGFKQVTRVAFHQAVLNLRTTLHPTGDPFLS